MLVQNKLSFQEIVELESVERRHVGIVHRFASGFPIQIRNKNLEAHVRCNGASRDPSYMYIAITSQLTGTTAALSWLTVIDPSTSDVTLRRTLRLCRPSYFMSRVGAMYSVLTNSYSSGSSLPNVNTRPHPSSCACAGSLAADVIECGDANTSCGMTSPVERHLFSDKQVSIIEKIGMRPELNFVPLFFIRIRHNEGDVDTE